jgi:hypothetical protein
MHIAPLLVNSVRAAELEVIQLDEHQSGWSVIVGFPIQGYSLIITTSEPYNSISGQLWLGSTVIATWEVSPALTSLLLSQAIAIVAGIEATIAAALSK